MDIIEAIKHQQYDQVIEHLAMPFEWYEQETKVEPYYHLLIAYMYDQGIQCTQDHKKAYEHLVKAHELNIVESLVPLGYYHLYINQMEKAIDYFKQAADLGNYQAMFEWLKLLEDGDDMFDYLTHQICKQDQIPVENYLGEYYMSKQDKVKALYYFNKGVEKNQSQAMMNLGLCMIAGIGVSQDIEQGVIWMQRAYLGGQTFALDVCLDALLKQGQVSKGYALLKELIRAGDKHARWVLGRRLATKKTFGTGLVQAYYHLWFVKDLEEAKPLFKKVQTRLWIQVGLLVLSLGLLVYMLK